MISLRVLFIALIIVGCEPSVDPKNETTEYPSQITVDGVSYTLTITKVAFALQDTLVFTYNVVNQSDSVRMYGFMNQQQMGYQFTDLEGNAKATYPVLYQPAGSSIILQPDEGKEFSVKSPLMQEYPNSIQRGEYRLSVFLLDNNSPKVYARITIQ